jgi:hypothetical protein
MLHLQYSSGKTLQTIATASLDMVMNGAVWTHHSWSTVSHLSNYESKNVNILNKLINSEEKNNLVFCV